MALATHDEVGRVDLRLAGPTAPRGNPGRWRRVETRGLVRWKTRAGRGSRQPECKTTWGAKGDARRRVVLPFRLVDGIKDASLLVERQFFLLQSFNDILAHSLLRVPPNLLQRWLYK